MNSQYGCGIGPIEDEVTGNGLSCFGGAPKQILQVIDHLVPETPVKGNALQQLDLPL